MTRNLRSHPDLRRPGPSDCPGTSRATSERALTCRFSAQTHFGVCLVLVLSSERWPQPPSLLPLCLLRTFHKGSLRLTAPESDSRADGGGAHTRRLQVPRAIEERTSTKERGGRKQVRKNSGEKRPEGSRGVQKWGPEERAAEPASSDFKTPHNC
ncbi:hypothetical protein H920_08123 [Fukomys damarensis]|uniref:Uncharacterized protein n=1 Tax=Fukomys damarensis TaxID=885580 RepID=A0A091DH67_FUKDA|nr:hypothetical protein H920_08123 [Fukomys damarensis]